MTWPIRFLIAVCFGILFGILIFGCSNAPELKPIDRPLFLGEGPSTENPLFVCGWVKGYRADLPMTCIPYPVFAAQAAKKHEL